ncbi:MAG: hypothetical protein J7500_11195 [Sphingomonas sp.]|uniref:hypothetical protein n=1 Tax=Sphingomonas sp. TaxID=28214 RepID=UPI001B1298EB|nr:hypothetical protein [Sphingomonas sp.]MBO9623265.1 hypothetical protein [Sphingomonas sp.]
MSTRTSSATILLLLAACDRVPSREAAAEPANATTADAAERIECAAAGETAFGRTCVVEREGAGLTLRHPDGGFRRLLLTQDGQLRAADGAEAAVVTPLGGGKVEVALGGARYRLSLAQ